jgi:hypothetical protein
MINCIGFLVVFLGIVWIFLFVASQIRFHWRDYYKPWFYNSKEKRRNKHRRRFAEYIEQEIRRLNSQEEWRDYRYADLEAEVEAEGTRKTISWIPLVRQAKSGLRRENSLSRAIENSTERIILLEGEPGSGKSIALRHVALRMSERATKSKIQRPAIPIFVNLKELSREKISTSSITTDPTKWASINLINLLRTRFDLNELKDICFHLGIEWENLSGTTKQEKSRELVNFCSRHQRLNDLQSCCQSLRPDISLLEEERTFLTPIDKNLIHSFVLQTLNRANDRDIEEFLEEEFDRGLKEGGWVFLFDSFDEIPEILSSAEADNVVQSYADAISDFLYGMNQCRGIVASRYFRGPKQVMWPRFRVLPLSDSRRLELIKRAELKPEIQQELLEKLGVASPEILSMSSNPLFLGLLCEYMRLSKPFPPNAYTVFEAYIENRFNRDQERLWQRFQLEPNEIRVFAEQIAFAMTADYGLGLNPTRENIKYALEKQPFQVSDHFNTYLDALEYIKLARSEVNLLGESIKTFTFSHRRFQEYFTTRLILREKQRVSSHQLVTDAVWRETTVTMCQTQLIGDLRPLLEEVAKLLGETVACLQNPVKTPLEYVRYTNATEAKEYKYTTNRLPIAFDWPPNALYLCELLQNGFGSRLGELPSEIRQDVARLILTVHTTGLIVDKKWAIEVAGTVPEEVLVWLLRDAFKNNSLWIREVAYKQVALLREIPEDIQLSIRQALLTMFGKQILHREQEATYAHLKRLDNASSFLMMVKILKWVPRIDLIIHIIFLFFMVTPWLIFLAFAQNIEDVLRNVSFAVSMSFITFVSYKSLRANYGGYTNFFGSLFASIFLIRLLAFPYILLSLHHDGYLISVDSLSFFQAYGFYINVMYIFCLVAWSWAPYMIAITTIDGYLHPVLWPFIPILLPVIMFGNIKISITKVINNFKNEWKVIIKKISWFIIKLLAIPLILFDALKYLPVLLIRNRLFWLQDLTRWYEWTHSRKHTDLGGRKFLELVTQYHRPSFCYRFIQYVHKGGLLTHTKDTDNVILPTVIN